MIKKLIICIYFFSVTCFAFSTTNSQNSELNNMLASANDCGQASATSDPNFCTSFKAVAQCHCTSSGLPKSMCQDMSLLYSRMVSIFGSIQHACEYQKDTSTQNCVNDWGCYRNGGRDSTGALCSSSGNACS